MRKLEDILLVSDIDGTALVHNKQTPSKNIEAVNRFIALGGSFTFATGRSPETAMIAVRQFKVTLPVIAFNGAIAFDSESGEVLSKKTLPADYNALAAEIADELSDLAGVMAVSGMDYIAVSQIEPGKTIASFHGIVTPKAARMEDITEPLYKLLLVAGRTEDTRRLRSIAGEKWGDRFSVMTSGDRYVELLPIGVNKGEAIFELARLNGINTDNIAVIGDNENDISMLEKAFISAAPASAEEEARLSADMVLCDCLDGALAEFIELLITKYQ